MGRGPQLPHVQLTDALRLCLILVDRDADRYPAAAVRWHARLCIEHRLTLPDAQLVLALVAALPTLPDAGPALASVLRRHGLDSAAEALDDWRTSRG